MQPHTGRFLLSSLIVAVIAGLLFMPGLPGDFVFDDIPNIVNNEAIKLDQLDADGLRKVVLSPQPSGSLRVVPTLSFAVDYWRAGGAYPAAFKATNILLHALTAGVLAWFFHSLLLAAGVAKKRTQLMAPILAIAWAAHPLQVSSVLYVVQRIQTMGTFFLILALWFYLQARQRQIEGRHGRTGLLLAFMSWTVAMGCKEDSIMLPAYTLALEVTVLHFAAADTRTASTLGRAYQIATIAGVAGYFFLVIPYFWQWDHYPGRDFSTTERLLTQARVLCMYVWQIMLPLPQHMPFYYDWLQPSRGLMTPWTTLPAIVAIMALLATAWLLRTRWPLFSFGLVLFFGAHFITSNVVDLEIAFEHRNHFALIGAVLAVGSLLDCISFRFLPSRQAMQATLCAIILLGLASATALRAHSWHSKTTLAHTITEQAPNSARGWIQLCAGYYESGGGPNLGNTMLDEAINACSNGAALASYALNNPILLIVLKTLKGNATQRDWEHLQQLMETRFMSSDNCRAPLILTYNYRKGVKLDKEELPKVLAVQIRRCPLKPYEIASIGYFVMNDLNEPDLAIPHFIRAIKAALPGDPFPQQLGAELRAKSRPDLAEKVERLGLDKRTHPDQLHHRAPD